jgi:hypothetical protein
MRSLLHNIIFSLVSPTGQCTVYGLIVFITLHKKKTPNLLDASVCKLKSKRVKYVATLHRIDYNQWSYSLKD